MSFDGISQNLWDANALDGLGNSDTLGGDINTAISINNIFIEANYLRLDTSNDPLTGILTINGSTSTSNDAYFSSDLYINNAYVSANVIANQLDGALVYGDVGEFGVDLDSMGLMVYNQLSVYNVATFGTKISVHDAVISNRISANTYYNYPQFNGDLNNRLSVNGSGYFHGNLSVSGITSTYAISANTYYNYPQFNGDLDNRISVNGAGYFNGLVSVNGITITSAISASTYYNYPQFNGDLNNTLSVSGSAIIDDDLSVSGSTYIKGILSLNGLLYTNQAIVNCELNNQAGIRFTLAAEDRTEKIMKWNVNYNRGDFTYDNTTGEFELQQPGDYRIFLKVQCTTSADINIFGINVADRSAVKLYRRDAGKVLNLTKLFYPSSSFVYNGATPDEKAWQFYHEEIITGWQQGDSFKIFFYGAWDNLVAPPNVDIFFNYQQWNHTFTLQRI
jgi:hypothetical protein